MSKNYLNGAQVGVFTEEMRVRVNHNMVDVCTSTADLAKTSSAAQSVIPGLVSETLRKGITYQFEAYLATGMTTNGGLTLKFNTPDTLTFTSVEYDVEAVAAASLAASRGTTITMGTNLLDSKAAAYIAIKITGSFIVNASGKLQLTAAQNTSHVDTTTIFKGSQIRLWEQVTNDVI